MTTVPRNASCACLSCSVNGADSLALIERRRRLRRIVNSVAPPGLSDEDAAAYAIVHASDPDRDPDDVMRSVKMTKLLAPMSFYRNKLQQLVRRRKDAGEPLDPEADEELANAMAASAAEELQQLIPGKALHEAHVRAGAGGQLTVKQDERYRRRVRFEHRMAGYAADRAEASRASKARHLAYLQARLARVQEERRQALAQEAAEEERAQRFDAVMSRIKPWRYGKGN